MTMRPSRFISAATGMHLGVAGYVSVPLRALGIEGPVFAAPGALTPVWRRPPHLGRA